MITFVKHNFFITKSKTFKFFVKYFSNSYLLNLDNNEQTFFTTFKNGSENNNDNY